MIDAAFVGICRHLVKTITDRSVVMESKKTRRLAYRLGVFFLCVRGAF